MSSLADQQLEIPITPPVSTAFYKQQVGIAVPRGVNTFAAILDVQTNKPLRFPTHSILLKTCWSAIVPLTSADVNASTVQLVLLKNLDDLFNNNLNDFVPIGDSNVLSDVNGKLTTDSSAIGQDMYVCPAVLCSFSVAPLLPEITDGTVKLIFKYI